MDMKTGFTNWHAVECDAFGRLSGLTARSGPAAGAAARRILVPVDGSAAALGALHVALRMADGPADVEVHLLNAQIVLGAGERDDTLLRQGLADTWAARAALDEAGLPYLLRLVAANPAEAILAHAREHAAAEIVMGADGAGSVACALLGSVAMDVLEKVQVPVTLAKSGCRAGEFPAEWVDWLIACDGSAASLRALRYALAQFAGRPRAPRLHLLNVRAPEGPLPATPDVATMAAEREQAAVDCREALDVLAAAGVGYDFHVAFGDPVAKILEVAEDVGCGHLVLGTRGLGWLGGLLLGSISGGVLRRSPLPVTLIR